MSVLERSQLMSWIRGDLVGPVEFLKDPALVKFVGHEFVDPETDRRGSLAWKPDVNALPEEILYFERESPHRKYGAGLLHPSAIYNQNQIQEDSGRDSEDEFSQLETRAVFSDIDDELDANEISGESDLADPENFDVTSPDIRYPSTIGLSFCVELRSTGRVLISLPNTRHFAWQTDEAGPVSVNGRYERCVRKWTDCDGTAHEAPAWRRIPAMGRNIVVEVNAASLMHGRKIPCPIQLPEGSPLSLLIEVFPRRLGGDGNRWLMTVVLRNVTDVHTKMDSQKATLYQTFFSVSVDGGELKTYPESQRSFDDLDEDEKSLALLYRESAAWGIGHGCAAGWEAGPSETPGNVFADVMPAVQLPSMTADIFDDAGNPIQLSMRELAELPAIGSGGGWKILDELAFEYRIWIEKKRAELSELDDGLSKVAERHLQACNLCLERIFKGITLLRSDQRARKAFQLANVSMLLQQIATKQLTHRPLLCKVGSLKIVHSLTIKPAGICNTPWDIYKTQGETNVGVWRAFQMAFLLMSLEGLVKEQLPDREIVDLIWFPTGGGKTEAYLGVMAFQLFHQRLLMSSDDKMKRDGTNVIMRYTLRMLTTQQFQRAAALICAMEFLRRNPAETVWGNISGDRFSLGLWIGQDGSPNNNDDAKKQLGRFRSQEGVGNPLVLTECPWCRAAIGRFDGDKPAMKPLLKDKTWKDLCVRGIKDTDEGPMLHCSDPACPFGLAPTDAWLPIEVIDERIYETRPSVIIGTVDKLAMLAFRPDAGALFGRKFASGKVTQSHFPPSLIIQDELHLISGPLGTMYALYEAIFERMCSTKMGNSWIKPKIIASTATIRGAREQILSLYGRPKMQLFPSPGLVMGDSFFGKYAKDVKGKLLEGRLYLGIHASDYGSVLTTQVRAYSSALFRPFLFEEKRRDPWWTLLSFYNSLRELGGAKTLFDSDIMSRLKFIFNREGFKPEDRRYPSVTELTSRLSQAELVSMMDRLAVPHRMGTANDAVDACLASSIIEVGVDIDRLSLMGVVGQPKTTAQYIQVTGRIGRRWWDRPGLVLMIYNPNKSRDRSHFEQFHSYHRRLYERVEPTSATPFAISAIHRALPGALLTWARQQSRAGVNAVNEYEPAITEALEILKDRCESVQSGGDISRSLMKLESVCGLLLAKWRQKPLMWEEFPPQKHGSYLMLWSGQYRTAIQERDGMVVASSMRQVDSSAELEISHCYSSKPSFKN